ncbi:MAG: anaerobic ribonucleoside-triphosphate reductase [Desulfotignum sp.]|nr:anaerobic ribonucleoside-triphosphate reductase [Desulfotignum sp.]
MGWDLQDLLLGWVHGRGRQGWKCPPPDICGRSFGAGRQLLYTLQGEAAGAQAMSQTSDTLLAPFVRRADQLILSRMVKQALQEFVFNINIPTRVGFQTPVYQYHHGPERARHPRADSPVIIGGQHLQDNIRAVIEQEMDTDQQAPLPRS